jgi:CHAT domain-containing protein
MAARNWFWGFAWLALLVSTAPRAEQASECLQEDPAVIQRPRTAAQEIALAGPPNTLDFANHLSDSGDAALERGDLAAAELYQRKALAVRQALEPRSLPVAASLNALGNVALQRGDLAKADDYLQSSLRIRTKLAPNSRDFALSLIGLGSVARRRGEVAREEAYFQQAQELGDVLTPSDLADVLDGLGNACSQRACSQKPRDYFDRALQLRRQSQPDSLGVAETLSFRGRSANLQGELQEAKRDFVQAIQLRRRLAPGSLVVATSLTDLGVVARTRGDLAEAELCFRKGLQIRQRFGPQSLAVADSLHNLGILFWLREDLPTAQEYLQQTLRIRRKLIPASPALAQSLIWQGLLYGRRGELAEAAAYFTQALDLLRKDFSSDSVAVAGVLNNLGNVARQRNELALSEHYYRRALEIQAKDAPDSPAEANTLQALAALARQHGQLAQAESYYRHALAIQEQKTPESSARAWNLLSLASLLRHEQDRVAAERLYAQAIDVLERQTAGLGGTAEDRSVFRARFENGYKDYIDLLIAQGRADMGLRVLERARAWALLEMLDRARVAACASCDSDLERQKVVLEGEIGSTSSYRIRLLDGGGVGGQLSELDHRLSQLQARYRETEEQIQLQSPAYTALQHPSTLTAQQVQALLDDDTLLLEYSLGAGGSYVWAVTSTGLTVYRLQARTVIEQAASRLRAALTARSLRTKETEAHRHRRLLLADAQYVSASRELSRLVLGPVKDLASHQRIVIVADGALQYVPFAALPLPTVSAGGDSRTGEDVPLVMQHEVANLPSASVLSQLRRQALERSAPSKWVAVLADPVFDARDERITAVPVGGPATAFLDRLLWTRVEAAQIMKVTPAGAGLQALDFDASRAMALSPALSEYRIVHFATHAVSDSAHPERTGLVLSLFDRQGQPQNGFLSLGEIYGLHLPADLVVLSACETALGREIGGEGPVGLVRGFMYAGATRVMASLWSVDDEVTAALMADFYKSLEEDKLSPAAALRTAQMAIRKESRWRQPYYWAGFQLQGEWR